MFFVSLTDVFFLRFIVHSDENNPKMSSLEDFAEVLEDFNPDLLLVGGLQMMDNFPFKEGERLQRLLKIRNEMRKVDSERTRVHFEMASFVDESLLLELTEYVVPYADSLGMNEQELPNLWSMLRHKNVSLVSDSNPRVASVLGTLEPCHFWKEASMSQIFYMFTDQMREVYKLLNGNSFTNDGKRPLTRLHVHTLAFQAIMTANGSRWKNTRLAAVKASLTANRHVCASNWVRLCRLCRFRDVTTGFHLFR